MELVSTFLPLSLFELCEISDFLFAVAYYFLKFEWNFVSFDHISSLCLQFWFNTKLLNWETSPFAKTFFSSLVQNLGQIGFLSLYSYLLGMFHFSSHFSFNFHCQSIFETQLLTRDVFRYPFPVHEMVSSNFWSKWGVFQNIEFGVKSQCLCCYFLYDWS